MQCEAVMLHRPGYPRCSREARWLLTGAGMVPVSYCTQHTRQRITPFDDTPQPVGRGKVWGWGELEWGKKP